MAGDVVCPAVYVELDIGMGWPQRNKLVNPPAVFSKCVAYLPEKIDPMFSVQELYLGPITMRALVSHSTMRNHAKNTSAA
jgi:hypothetical protein